MFLNIKTSKSFKFNYFFTLCKMYDYVFLTITCISFLTIQSTSSLFSSIPALPVYLGHSPFYSLDLAPGVIPTPSNWI